jgi:apolipoprotein N-acyltransferase
LQESRSAASGWLGAGGLALSSGALLALSFPRFGHPAVAWAALAPLLVALARWPHGAVSPSRGFWLGWTTGAVYFTGTLYWLSDVMVTFGGLPPVAAWPVALLLVAYLSIYTGIFGWLLARALRRFGPGALWLAPPLWTGTEFLRGWLFTGFPWVTFGYSQATVLPIVQLASVGGVALISLLLVTGSASLAVAALGDRRQAVRAVALSAGLVAAAAGWGQWRIARGELASTGPVLRVGIVQGNVAQSQKWDPAHAREIFQRYLDLTRRVARGGARLIVWPESATPFSFEEEPEGREAVLGLAREVSAWLVLGSNQIERGSPARYYNAAFLVSPAGQQAAVYRKVHLVPFGEYVPLRSLLFFARPLVDGIGDFAHGREVTPLEIDGRRVSTVICYESVFPYLAREAVTRHGSQLLTAITNDAWYGWSSAPFQHFEQGAVRAVEFGRYFVRAANTGISGIVDPYGRVVASRGLFETATLDADVRLLDGRTAYATIGDSFAWASVGVMVLSWWLTRRALPRPARRTPWLSRATNSSDDSRT